MNRLEKIRSDEFVLPRIPIAIVGVGCRFPGGIGDPESLWQFLIEGRNAITDVPEGRWDEQANFSPGKPKLGKLYVQAGGYLDEVDRFDADFFSISRREAEQMDPQQRLLLEMSWEAFEDAGIVPGSLSGKNVGVFVGISSNDYSRIQSDNDQINAYTNVGNAASIAANRLSHFYDFRGPSLSVDTACSSSLVALHQACLSLREGSSHVAMIGGVNLVLSPQLGIGFCQASMLSPGGQCRSFDRKGDGYVRAEGGGVLLIQPLADAIAQGNKVYATIVGTGVNSDGHTPGIFLPSADAQADLLDRVYSGAGIDPASVDYVEAHGTGTAVGDPIECEAIGRVLGAERPRDAPVLVGSVKANIGHLEPAAGIAGVIKAIEGLRHRALPPTYGYKNPNPNIDFQDLNLSVVDRQIDLDGRDKKLVFGVNSFGFGGTNAHAVLQEYVQAFTKAGPRTKDRLPFIVSGHTEEALHDNVERHVELLESGNAPANPDLCGAAVHQRTHFDHRTVAFASGHEELAGKLAQIAAGELADGSATGNIVSKSAKTAFVFSGNGSQWQGMGRDLLRSSRCFHDAVVEVDDYFAPLSGWSLIAELQRPASRSRLDRTEYAQPALFGVQVGLLRILDQYGVACHGAIGHSVGEIAAAFAAGILSLEQATRVIFERSRHQEITAGSGRMAAVGLGIQDAEELVARYSGRIFIGSVNSPQSVTLSGEADALVEVERECNEAEIFYRLLDLNYPFHSASMDPIEDDLVSALGDLRPGPASKRFVSTVTGGTLEGKHLDADYWWRNVRRPVLFHEGLSSLVDDGYGIFVEIGPHPILQHYIRECEPSPDGEIRAIATLKREGAGVDLVESSVAACITCGAQVDLEGLVDRPAQVVPLPTYPWQKERFWPEVPYIAADHPLLGYRQTASDFVWTNELDRPELGYLADHVVQGATVFPAAGYLEMAFAAAGVVLNSSGCELSEIDIRRPIVLNDDHATVTELSLSPEDGTFKINSRAKAGTGAWTTNLIGRLGVLSGKPKETCLDIEAMRGRLDRQFTKPEHYGMAARFGLQYKGRFQGVKAVWAGDGEALGEIEKPGSLRSGIKQYWLHPALLDACLQTVLGLLPNRKGPNNPTYLPVQVRHIRIYRRAAGLRYCHVRLEKLGVNAILASLTLTDSRGQIIAEFEGFRFQKIGLGAQETNEPSQIQIAVQLKSHRHDRATNSTSPIPDPGGLVDPDQVKQLVASSNRASYYKQVQPRVDTMCASFFLRALQNIGVGPGGKVSIEAMMGRGKEAKPVTAARAALESKDRGPIVEYLEEMLPDAILGKWPRGRSGRLKTDRRTLHKFANEGAVAELLKDQQAVTPANEQFLVGIVERLSQDGYLSKSRGGWKIAKGIDTACADSVWRDLIADNPAGLPEYLLLGRCGRHYGDILTGKTDPFEVMPLATLEHFYEATPNAIFYNQLAEMAFAEAIRRWPKDRPIRILEVGAGTGGLTSRLLRYLPADKTEYVFTDVSEAFLSGAEIKFADCPFVNYRVLDLEQDPHAQGFGRGSFDLVIANNVVHATCDVATTLGRCRDLICEGGLLLMQEIHQNYQCDAIFGLLKGWWAFADHDLRPNSPLLPAETWPKALAGSGFSQIQTLNDAGVTDRPLSSVFLAKRDFVDPAAKLEPKGEPEVASGKTWLVLSDPVEKAPLSETIIAGLQRAGETVIEVCGSKRIGTPQKDIDLSDREDMLSLLKTVRDTHGEVDEVLHLAGLEVAEPDRSEGLEALGDRRCLSAVNLVGGMAEQGWKSRLWLVTRNGQSNPLGRGMVNPSQSALWGLGRVIQNEHPDLSCRLVDLCTHGSDLNLADRLVNELTDPEGEDEILLSANARHVNRVQQLPDPVTSKEDQQVRSAGSSEADGYRLGFSSQGSLDNLRIESMDVKLPEPGHISIKVRAAGLNFRDVMWAMGILPAEALENGFAGATLGMECAGEVAAVGKGVSDFSVGDPVIAFASGCIGSHVEADTNAVAPMPKGLSFDEAATIPTVFFTAYYALKTLAGLRPGERVVIHGAAGGVGLAAIQVAKWLGAEIYATAGTPEKREFIQMLGVDRVYDSRSLAFHDDIMAATGGEGVDVVLNSLAGDAIFKSLSLLKPFGRFLEIGKRDLYANSKLGLRPFRNNISFFAIDADQLMVEKRDLAGAVFGEMVDMFERGVFRPLVHRVFSNSRITDAFRHMQQSKHIGKIVISMDESGERDGNHSLGDLHLRKKGTYLVTGGTRGFGLRTAQWLVSKGAKNLILLSRSGAAATESRAAIRELRGQGVRVKAPKCDISDYQTLERVLKRALSDMPALKGVVHAAMVLDDGILAQTDRERWWRVMAPKAVGAIHLDRLTRKRRLDFFVAYSSAAAIVGNPGQGNYCAANLFLEGLMERRRAQGLPGTAVSWGAIDDVGYLARETEIKDIIEDRIGFAAVKSDLALEILENILIRGGPDIGIAAINWSKALGAMPNSASPKFDRVRPSRSEDAADIGAGTEMAALLMALPEDDRIQLVTEILSEQIASILRMPVDKLDINGSLLDMGIDSLMGVEMQMSIEKHFGIEFPAMELMGGASVSRIAMRILSLMAGGSEPEQAKQSPIENKQVDAALDDVDELSDEAVDLYLKEMMAADDAELETVK